MYSPLQRGEVDVRAASPRRPDVLGTLKHDGGASHRPGRPVVFTIFYVTDDARGVFSMYSPRNGAEVDVQVFHSVNNYHRKRADRT